MPTQDIVQHAAGRQDVIVPLDTQEVTAAMTRYQEGLKSILSGDDWQTFKTRKGEPGQFLKKSGWRKIALWFNLDLELREREIDRGPDGMPLRARVVARATHPNGRYADGDGYCSASEGGFNKPENDIPGTAATRATNRAISNLVGMGDVSAEEIEGIETTGQYGPPATQRDADGALRAIRALYNDTSISLDQLATKLETDAGDYLPKIVARALMLVAAHRPNRSQEAGAVPQGAETEGATETGNSNREKEPQEPVT